jgi:hypothetical protein
MRFNIINKLIQKYNYSTYLEIGLANGDNWNKINILSKESVDPSTQTSPTYRMTSDEFFKQNNKKYDIIFIDGLHHSDQVDRDIQNSLTVLNDGGSIVLHDCSPTTEEMQRVPQVPGAWTGDVWKSIVKFIHSGKYIKEYNCFVIDIDYGCGVVTKHQLFPDLEKLDLPTELTYDWLAENRKAALNLVSYEAFTKLLL